MCSLLAAEVKTHGCLLGKKAFLKGVISMDEKRIVYNNQCRSG